MSDISHMKENSSDTENSWENQNGAFVEPPVPEKIVKEETDNKKSHVNSQNNVLQADSEEKPAVIKSSLEALLAVIEDSEQLADSFEFLDAVAKLSSEGSYAAEMEVDSVTDAEAAASSQEGDEFSFEDDSQAYCYESKAIDSWLRMGKIPLKWQDIPAGISGVKKLGKREIKKDFKDVLGVEKLDDALLPHDGHDDEDEELVYNFDVSTVGAPKRPERSSAKNASLIMSLTFQEENGRPSRKAIDQASAHISRKRKRRGQKGDDDEEEASEEDSLLLGDDVDPTEAEYLRFLAKSGFFSDDGPKSNSKFVKDVQKIEAEKMASSGTTGRKRVRRKKVEPSPLQGGGLPEVPVSEEELSSQVSETAAPNTVEADSIQSAKEHAKKKPQATKSSKKESPSTSASPITISSSPSSVSISRGRPCTGDETCPCWIYGPSFHEAADASVFSPSAKPIVPEEEPQDSHISWYGGETQYPGADYYNYPQAQQGYFPGGYRYEDYYPPMQMYQRGVPPGPMSYTRKVDPSGQFVEWEYKMLKPSEYQQYPPDYRQMPPQGYQSYQTSPQSYQSSPQEHYQTYDVQQYPMQNGQFRLGPAHGTAPPRQLYRTPGPPSSMRPQQPGYGRSPMGQSYPTPGYSHQMPPNPYASRSAGMQIPPEQQRMMYLQRSVPAPVFDSSMQYPQDYRQFEASRHPRNES